MYSLFDDEKHAKLSFEFVLHGEGIPPGGFATHLIEAFIRSDGDNFNRLEKAYPAYGKAARELLGRGD